MLVTVAEAKNWLRIDGNEDDALLQTLIDAAVRYIRNATGRDFEGDELAKVLALVLVADWYENRELIGKTSDQVRPMVRGILLQLGYSYPDEGSDPA